MAVQVVERADADDLLKSHGFHNPDKGAAGNVAPSTSTLVAKPCARRRYEMEGSHVFRLLKSEA